MAGVARYMDMTIGQGSHGLKCCPHEIVGFWIHVSPDIEANDLGVVRVGDISIHDCPHCPNGFALTGADITYGNDIVLHRLGDSVDEVCGSGTTVTGSPDVDVEG